MPSREASHAGSWYSSHGPTLASQLDQWLSQVPDQIEGVGSLPVPGARIIIAPHAGFAYSGACAAFAYKALDLSKAKRIFLLGPSHHHSLPNLALSQLTGYSTPLSKDPLPLDTELMLQLKNIQSANSTTRFTTMSPSVDEAEHSLEMHLPYIHRLLQRQLPSSPTSAYPPLVPIMVGNTSAATERAFGQILAPYVANPENAFIISSDFCHWGLRFGYTYYIPDAPAPGPELPLSHDALPQPSAGFLTSTSAKQAIDSVSSGGMLRSKDRISKGAGVPTIHESISACDIACMAAIASGDTQVFLDGLRNTGNTICGRHPIGVIMAALDVVLGKDHADKAGEMGQGLSKGKFNFLRYERSSDAISVQDSSVSYVSAFAVL